MTSLYIPDILLKQLLDNPAKTFDVSVSGVGCQLSFVIPDYAENLQKYYTELLKTDLSGFSQALSIPMPFKHFGVQCRFNQAIELDLHDEEMSLLGSIRQLIDDFGPLFLKNVYMRANYRDMGHRNRFPHLSFHIDRSVNQPTPYSLYTRDPFDAEQRHPRTASTLFIPNLAAYLQCMKEGACHPDTDKVVRPQYQLFGGEEMTKVLGNIVAEQTWDDPEGTGEVAIIDNRTVLHSSYYRSADRDSYRIGVRYVK